MKIKSVVANNRKKSFEVNLGSRVLSYPYSQLKIRPTPHDGIEEVFSDPDLGHQAFTYRLGSGKYGSVHQDQVLEYHQDKNYLREMLLYKLSVQAQKIIEIKKISKREIMRKMGVLPAQFYRLIDQTFYHKTIDQMVRLLAALDCSIEMKVKHAA